MRNGKALALAGSVACLVGCDRATKLAALVSLRDRAAVPIVPGVVDLSYRENADVAFSALSRLSLHAPAWSLTVLAAMATLAVGVAWARRAAAPWHEHAAFAAVMAGAVGNVIDRFLRGRVIDFIHVHHWPVFNVADMLVTTGAALFMLGGARARARSGKPPAASAP